MSDHPLIVRVSNYSRSSGSWSCVYEFNHLTIQSVTCSFVSPHIEDRATVTIADRGVFSVALPLGVPLASTRDELAAFRAATGPLYRIDIFTAETSELIDTREVDASGDWINGVLYWSGYIDNVQSTEGEANRSITIQCIGWTGMLDRMTIRDKFYSNTSIRDVVIDLFNDTALGLDAQWPGDLVRLNMGTNGSDRAIILDRVGWKAATFRQIFDQLAALGNFQYGISVSGYPFSEGANAEEFVFVQFAEPFFDLDVANDDGIDHVFDVRNDPRVTEFVRFHSDSRYTTRWEFLGDTPYVDFLSVISGHDRDQVNDTASIASGDSGAFQWEPGGFKGWQLSVLDTAIRAVDKDNASGQVYSAGRIVPVTAKITRDAQDATFEIDSYSESGGESIFGIYRFPAPTENLNLGITSKALRYTITPGSAARVVRVVMDEEADDPTTAVGRERSSRIVDNPTVRGYLQAGVFALQERTQERFSAERARLRYQGFTRFYSGSSSNTHARVGVLDGHGRMTLMGTVANGGDEWAVGDDDRETGPCLLLEIRRAEAEWTEDGWTMTYDLGGSPRDFATVLLPSSIRTRNLRRT